MPAPHGHPPLPSPGRCPATTAEVTAWAGPADRRALRGALTACRLLGPATASLGIAAAVVSAYGGWDG
ncbi:hypothetical protein ABZ760_32130 [Streptomyces sp. NPDC006658]|uniref:hypothetical protein n=1 Tax=Streptomyces sp. NPDC006658 TaxID=3156900 RepID=UPI0033E58EE9